MATGEKKSLDTPDQVLKMDLGKINIVEIAGADVRRATYEPGWKWSLHQRPVVNGGEYCDVSHFIYLAAGHFHVVFADGSELDVKAGDVATLPAGHNGWVVGDEPVIMIDFGDVAKPF